MRLALNLLLQECSLDVAAGETTEIGLRFIPQKQCDKQIIYVFVKDDENIEETFSIVANYSWKHRSTDSDQSYRVYFSTDHVFNPVTQK